MVVVHQKEEDFNSFMLKCIENQTNSKSSLFLIEPLELGQGITIGNTLRRTLLSDIPGLAVSDVKFNNVLHEFKSISGVREDIIEILLNLKELIFKDIFLFENFDKIQKAFLYVKGPGIITANKIKLPSSGLQIVNNNNYICTLLENSFLFCEMLITKGRGYQLASDNSLNFSQKNSFIKLDTIFTPVVKVNFKIRLINDSFGNLCESLILEIETNGSVSPKRVLKEALKKMLTLFTTIFMSSDVLQLQ